MAVNTQHKRVSKNRVSITYDVETNGAVEQRELPFVVGVIGEFSGDKPDDEKEDIDLRHFTDIDKDNFDSIMSTINPQLDMKVNNRLEEDGSEFNVSLSFGSMRDFEPANVVQQVEPLKHLLDVRNQLRELLAHADRSRGLEKLLKEVLQNTDALSSLCEELGITPDDTDAEHTDKPSDSKDEAPS